MSKLNSLPAKKMVKILLRLGFSEIRVKGSHHFFLNSVNKRTTTIPIHSNEDLGVGILKEILKDIELPTEEYEELRRKV